MIARLTGTLVHSAGDRGILDVGGVGYEVFATASALGVWTGAGTVTLHISTQVREDAITLYGFLGDTQRLAFLALLGVTGVGPKMALAALDSLGVEVLCRAVETDDTGTLTRVPGVGAKKAQRLALELKGKLPMSFEAAPAGPSMASPGDPLPLALAQLEYGKTEIDRALAALAEQGVAADAPVPVRLAAALRVLGGQDR